MNQDSEKTLDFEGFRNSLFIPPSKKEDEEFCRYHYNKYLLQVEREKQSRLDDNYFEPYNNSQEAGVSKAYREKLHQIFNTAEMRDGEMAFMILPSFEPEKILFMKKGWLSQKLTVKTFKDNFWGEHYSGKRNALPETYAARISAKERQSLQSCLESHFNSARKARNEKWILDGVQYYILKKNGDQLHAVFKHSPYEKSRTGVLVEHLENLMKAVQEENKKRLRSFPPLT